MEYVNYKGEVVKVEAGGKKPKAPAKPKTGEITHKGFFAVGFSPDQIEEGRRIYEAERELAASNGRSMPPFNEESFMRVAKPRKIRTQPYATQSAAVHAGELAEKTAGWKNTSWRDATGKK